MAQEQYNFELMYTRIKKLEKEIIKRTIPFKSYTNHAQDKKWYSNPEAYLKLQKEYPGVFPENLRNDQIAQNSPYITSDDTKLEKWAANHSIKNIIAGRGIYSSHPEYTQKYFNHEAHLLKEFLESQNVTLIVSLGIGRRSQLPEKENHSDFYHYWHSGNFTVNRPIKFAQIFVENGTPLFFDYQSILDFDTIYQEIKNLPTQEKVFAHCLAGIGRTGSFLYLVSYYFHLEENKSILKNYEEYLLGDESVADTVFEKLVELSLNILSKLRMSRPAIEGESQLRTLSTILVAIYFLIIKDYRSLEQWCEYTEAMTLNSGINPTPIDMFELMPEETTTMTPLSAKLELQKIDLLIGLLPYMEKPSNNSNAPEKGIHQDALDDRSINPSYGEPPNKPGPSHNDNQEEGLNNNLTESSHASRSEFSANNNASTENYNDTIIISLAQLGATFSNTLNSDWKSVDISEIRKSLKIFNESLAIPKEQLKIQGRDYFIISLIKHYFDRFCYRFDTAIASTKNNIQSLFFNPSAGILPIVQKCKSLLARTENSPSVENIGKTAIELVKVIDLYFATHIDSGKYYSTYDFTLTNYHHLETEFAEEDNLFFDSQADQLDYFSFYQNLNFLHYELLSNDADDLVVLNNIQNLVKNVLSILKKYQEEKPSFDGGIYQQIKELGEAIDNLIEKVLKTLEKTQISKTSC